MKVREIKDREQTKKEEEIISQGKKNRGEEGIVADCVGEEGGGEKCRLRPKKEEWEPCLINPRKKSKKKKRKRK